MDGSNNDHDSHGDGDCISGKAFKSIVYLDSDDNITRDSMAIMFYRAAGAPTVTQAQLNAVTFKDISSCSANVKKAIAWAVSAGIVKGFTKERYGPLEKSTRLQVAIMLYRFYK